MQTTVDKDVIRNMICNDEQDNDANMGSDVNSGHQTFHAANCPA